MSAIDTNNDLPQYETLMSHPEDESVYHMMSRMNWMTYLKVLYDKLVIQRSSYQPYEEISPQTSQDFQANKVELFKLMEALNQIKNLLPLLPREEYIKKHSSEKGFSIYEVEMGLKQFQPVNNQYSNINQQNHHISDQKQKLLSWDDIIDIFLSQKNFNALSLSLTNKQNKLQPFQMSSNTGLTSNTTPMMGNNGFSLNIDHSNMFKDINEEDDENLNDDLVNISSECNIDEGILSRIKPTVFKEYRGGLGFSQSKSNQSSGISKMIRKQEQIQLLKENQNSQNDQSHDDYLTSIFKNNKMSCVQNEGYFNPCHLDSPPVEMIAKKIEFRDTSTLNHKGGAYNKGYTTNSKNNTPGQFNINNQLNYGGCSEYLSSCGNQQNNIGERTESRITGNNNACSFYLTPSSGIETPSLLQISQQINALDSSQTIKQGDLVLHDNVVQSAFDKIIGQQQTSQFEYNNNQNNPKVVFVYPIPFENSNPLNTEQDYDQESPLKSNASHRKLISIDQMLDSPTQYPQQYYDINFSNMKAVSSMQIPIVKRENQKAQLRAINLCRNMFSRIYLLHPLQQQQLLILNMSHNLIQSLSGIEQCTNLQLLNLSHNMITDISQLSNLKQLQEIYLSHNLISSLILSKNNQEISEEDESQEIDNIYYQTFSNENHIFNSNNNYFRNMNSNNFIIWPHLEIFDLTSNKLNDYDEILQLKNGMALRKEVIKIIGIKGNSFYNFQEQYAYPAQCINTILEHKDIIEQYSNYNNNEELQKLCFYDNNNSYSQSIIGNSNYSGGHQSKLSVSTQGNNTLSLVLNNQNQGQIQGAIANKNQSKNTLLGDIRADQRQSKTRLEVRTSHHNLMPSSLSHFQSRSTSRNTRPITSLYQSQQFYNKLKPSGSQQNKIRNSSSVSHDSKGCQGGVNYLSHNRQYNCSSLNSRSTTNQIGLAKQSVQKNFKQTLTMISKKLSLKDKENNFNYTLEEKPLSRNVKFLNFSNHPQSSLDLDNSQQSVLHHTIKNSQIRKVSPQNKSQLSNYSSSNFKVLNQQKSSGQSSMNQSHVSSFSARTSLIQPHILDHKQASQHNINNDYYKRSILNNQLKKSIDLTLSYSIPSQNQKSNILTEGLRKISNIALNEKQPLKANKASHPNTTKHNSSQSFSFTTSNINNQSTIQNQKIMKQSPITTPNSNYYKQKSEKAVSDYCQSLSALPNKRKQTSPIKPVKLREKSWNQEELMSLNFGNSGSNNNKKQSQAVVEENSDEEGNSQERFKKLKQNQSKTIGIKNQTFVYKQQQQQFNTQKKFIVNFKTTNLIQTKQAVLINKKQVKQTHKNQENQQKLANQENPAAKGAFVIHNLPYQQFNKRVL